MESEALILRQLSEHPGVIKMHQAVKTINNLYLFTDYCDQGDLKSFMRKNKQTTARFNEYEARYIVSQVVEGMKYLNLHNIVHRDIKTDNILVKTKKKARSDDIHNEFIVKRIKNSKFESLKQSQFNIEEYEFKLADLGLARSVTHPDEWIKTMCGTPVCMAPEVVTGNLYNYKVDVWSIGTLLFHLITGTYPFKGKNIQELKDNLIQGVYKIPRDVVVSIECLDFLNCCLRFESKKRKDFTFLFNHPFLLNQSQDFQSTSTTATSSALKFTYLSKIAHLSAH